MYLSAGLRLQSVGTPYQVVGVWILRLSACLCPAECLSFMCVS